MLQFLDRISRKISNAVEADQYIKKKGKIRIKSI